MSIPTIQMLVPAWGAAFWSGRLSQGICSVPQIVLREAGAWLVIAPVRKAEYISRLYATR
jgi:hypothetical protein